MLTNPHFPTFSLLLSYLPMAMLTIFYYLTSLEKRKLGNCTQTFHLQAISLKETPFVSPWLAKANMWQKKKCAQRWGQKSYGWWKRLWDIATYFTTYDRWPLEILKQALRISYYLSMTRPHNLDGWLAIWVWPIELHGHAYLVKVFDFIKPTLHCLICVGLICVQDLLSFALLWCLQSHAS